MNEQTIIVAQQWHINHDYDVRTLISAKISMSVLDTMITGRVKIMAKKVEYNTFLLIL